VDERGELVVVDEPAHTCHYMNSFCQLIVVLQSANILSVQQVVTDHTIDYLKTINRCLLATCKCEQQTNMLNLSSKL